jgi:hypothetical protein
MRPSSRDKIRELWEEHQAAEFPPELYENPGAIEMVSVDSTIAGCVSSVVDTGRLSDPAHATALNGCLEDLRALAPLLKSAEATLHCQRLISLVLAVRERFLDA